MPSERSWEGKTPSDQFWPHCSAALTVADRLLPPHDTYLAKWPGSAIIALVMPSERIQRRIDALFDEADAAADERDWAIVGARAEDILAIDEANADAVSDHGSRVAAMAASARPTRAVPER